MTTSATVTPTRTVHPTLVAGSIGGLCVAIGLVVGIGIGAGLTDGSRSDVAPAPRNASLVSPTANHGIVYTGIPAPRSASLVSPVANHGLVYTGIPYTASPTGR
ncbi:MAG TPA: hypothetical protein VGQ89_08110 [Candidatus Limnocylindrales bacterium]|nr:hypothetical protein [Candidatus Limnocylindrales bacterium]